MRTRNSRGCGYCTSEGRYFTEREQGRQGSRDASARGVFEENCGITIETLQEHGKPKAHVEPWQVLIAVCAAD